MINTALIFSSVKSYYHNKRWQSRTILTLLAVIIIFGIARLLLPQTIIYSTTSWLQDQGIDSTIEAINIDIIDGTISVVNANGHKNGIPLFNVGLIDINWRWTPLSEKTVVVTNVSLDKFNVNIKQYNDEIIIGGVHIPFGPPATDESNDQVKPWAASLGEVIFTKLNICYLQHTAPFEQANNNSLYVDYCVDLEKMSWLGTISYATDSALLKTDDMPLSSTGNFTLNGLSVTDNKLNKKLLISKSNTLTGVSISGLKDLNIKHLEMNELSLLQRDDKKQKDSIRFSQLSIDDIKLSELNSLFINNININNPGAYLVKQNQTDWEYQQWIPTAPDTNQTIEKQHSTKQVPSDSSFKITLNNIAINDSDLCYQDIKQSLSYCLAFANLDWRGLVKYNAKDSQANAIDLQAKGDLTLLRHKIHNQAIERDLLVIDSLTLSKLDISSINSVALDNINIKNFSALQRSKNNKDHTASFEELTLNALNYTENKININTIALTGLASTVSKNKNGGWEFDKWLTDNKTDDTTSTTQTKPQSTNNETIIISLNKVKVTSDNKILFTDNSTEPAMEIGLQNLAFNISDLHSAKPDANSSFKLYAKTNRHSTIDVEGTVKPFAEKLSFDATGKLKGFDLRAATPVTKKAIGHIIKSGQMDADLKLLATNGELDSNIGLSLYHFNLKATSKEDAAKLDAKFGMPLNQTLVLLRDKDDSIHLDIPITGDVNNPDFDPMDAVIKATSKAATFTLITFYTPYGLIYAGGNLALNLATALNFDPINFNAGSPEILAEAKEQLDGLSKLLTERPQVHLTLCGTTNQQDVSALFPELKEKHSDKNKEGDKISAVATLTEQQTLQLKQLATERQENSKNYLVDKIGIKHDRLILCEPEHNTDADAIAGVEINI